MVDHETRDSQVIRLSPAEVALVLFGYLQETNRLEGYDATLSFDVLRKGWNGIQAVEVNLNYGETAHVA